MIAKSATRWNLRSTGELKSEYVIYIAHVKLNKLGCLLIGLTLVWREKPHVSQFEITHSRFGHLTGKSFMMDLSFYKNPFFDESQALSLPLNVEWIPSREGTYYTSASGLTKVKAIDMMGIEIVITSLLPLDELNQLIANLQYSGADLEKLHNPWRAACQR